MPRTACVCQITPASRPSIPRALCDSSRPSSSPSSARSQGRNDPRAPNGAAHEQGRLTLGIRFSPTWPPPPISQLSPFLLCRAPQIPNSTTWGLSRTQHQPMRTPTPKQSFRGWATPKHLRSPEFREHLRRAAAKGGRSRSLAKIDAARRNGRLAGKRGKKPGPQGPHIMVPPLNAVEVWCAAGCGFSMLLSRQAMEANSRGRAVAWTCPQCNHAGNRIEPRTCPAPVMPSRPASPPDFPVTTMVSGDAVER